MAAATILHVGDDVCHRIPVMESGGLVVVRSEPSVDGIQSAFSQHTSFSAIALISPSPILLSTARKLSEAPVVLFQDSSGDSDEYPFDLIITAQTPPSVWLKSLGEVIEEARKFRKLSQPLREEPATVRAKSRALCEAAANNQVKWGTDDE